MTDRLQMLIDEVIGTNSAEDFALFYVGGEWRAEWKNPNDYVMLGENEGEFQSKLCATPQEAISDLLMHIRMDYEAA